jgi:ATPase subunit of ABC transporter with duplicated ATPase domains
MRLFKINELSLTFAGLAADKRIFERASLMICSGEHIGLVGPNGCGKSTFLKILTGEIVPDVFDMEKLPNLKIGWLDQYANIDKDLSLYDYLQSIFEELFEIDRQVSEIYATLHELDGDAQIKAMNKAERLNEFLLSKEFDSIPKKIENVLFGLGFTGEDLKKQVNILSGGQKTKTVLAKILLEESDILVLDEPTNFLDVKYIAWLGDYLKKLERAYIIISHDRAFLNKVSHRIVEIANGKLKVYEGDFDFYLKEKERREAIQEQQQIAQAKYIQRSEEYVSKWGSFNITGAGKTKATWLKKMLKTLERMEKPEIIVRPEFKFKHNNGAATTILRINDLEIGYDKALLPPVTLEIKKGDKVLFQGFNGVGKTTLLKTINQDIPAISGSFEYGEYIKSVFLKQEEDYENNFSSFDKHDRKAMGIFIDGKLIMTKGTQREITTIEFAKEYYPEIPTNELQKCLRLCGLTERHFFAQVRKLSGGEMTKVRMCLAMMQEVNLIILDEPTNHLDIYSKEVLTHALAEFEGTIIMTTHDINFDTGWATKIINLA